MYVCVFAVAFVWFSGFMTFLTDLREREDCPLVFQQYSWSSRQSTCWFHRRLRGHVSRKLTPIPSPIRLVHHPNIEHRTQNAKHGIVDGSRGDSTYMVFVTFLPWYSIWFLKYFALVIPYDFWDTIWRLFLFIPIATIATRVTSHEPHAAWRTHAHTNTHTNTHTREHTHNTHNTRIHTHTHTHTT